MGFYIFLQKTSIIAASEKQNVMMLKKKAFEDIAFRVSAV
jgi:hypothetical protein